MSPVICHSVAFSFAADPDHLFLCNAYGWPSWMSELVQRCEIFFMRSLSLQMSCQKPRCTVRYLRYASHYAFVGAWALSEMCISERSIQEQMLKFLPYLSETQELICSRTAHFAVSRSP